MRERSQPTPSVPIELRAMARTGADLSLIRAAFEKNGDRVRSSAAFEWQYFENPSNELFVDLATVSDGGQESLAAVYATLPVHARVRGTRQLAIQSLDTLTDAAHRGRGHFHTLAGRTFGRATSAGVAFVYGFPNGRSAPGFFGKLGWRSLDPLPFLIRPLRLDYAAERLRIPDGLRALLPRTPLVLPARVRSRRGVRTLETADSRITALWQRFANGIGVAVERDAAYFQWRIFDKPEECYRTLVIERGSGLSALCTFTTKSKHGGSVGYVMELLHDRTLRGLADGAQLLGLAMSEMAEQGADVVLAWALPHGPNFPAYLRHLFVPFPEKLRPIELHFGARAFDDASREVVENRRSWYVSYLDSDTV